MLHLRGRISTERRTSIANSGRSSTGRMITVLTHSTPQPLSSMDFAETCTECSPGSKWNSIFFFKRSFATAQRECDTNRAVVSKLTKTVVFDCLAACDNDCAVTSTACAVIYGHKWDVLCRRGHFRSRRVITGCGGPFLSGKGEFLPASVFFLLWKPNLSLLKWYFFF